MGEPPLADVYHGDRTDGKGGEVVWPGSGALGAAPRARSDQDCLESAGSTAEEPDLPLSPISFLGVTSISSVLVMAFLKFFTLRPSASPICGNLPAPKITTTISSRTISSPMPSCPHIGKFLLGRSRTLARSVGAFNGANQVGGAVEPPRDTDTPRRRLRQWGR